MRKKKSFADEAAHLKPCGPCTTLTSQHRERNKILVPVLLRRHHMKVREAGPKSAGPITRHGGKQRDKKGSRNRNRKSISRHTRLTMKRRREH